MTFESATSCYLKKKTRFGVIQFCTCILRVCVGDVADNETFVKQGEFINTRLAAARSHQVRLEL